MLESGFAKGGQSQGMVDGGKLGESRRWRCWSRRQCFFCVLVLAAVLFFYTTDIKEMAPDWSPKWWTRYNATRWWNPFKSQWKNVASPNKTDSSTTAAAAAAAAGFTAQTTLFPFPQTGRSTTTTHLTTNVSVLLTKPVTKPATKQVTKQATKPATKQATKPATKQVIQKTPAPPAPVPYVSPGPYLVEYPYEYHFVINEPQTCEQHKPFLVLVVPVAPHNRAHRDIIRQTWGGESLVLGKAVQLLFLLGLHAGAGAEQLQQQLLQESKEHRDLIQSDFLDCYKNLTIKTMVMLEWLDSHCSGASYAMKIDSDMFLNVPKLVAMLSNAPKTNYMTGLVARGAAVLRDPNSKWYLPVEIYPQSQYPRYALGLGYVLSLDLPKKLVGASRHVKAVYIEDVYLGLCMQHLGIAPTDPPDWGYFNVFPVQYGRCAYSKLIATTTNEHFDRVAAWTDFKKPGRYC